MELALAPTLASSAAVPTRPNRATQRSVPAFLNKLYRCANRPTRGARRETLSLRIASVPCLEPAQENDSHGDADTATPCSMVSDTSTDDLIRWSEDGESFFGPFHPVARPAMMSNLSLSHAGR